ncbi:sensor histidine kinase [Flavilitoribacter nigricans]|uniref:Signal transduction histidine kinase internal region domain-containing protein n=1 Tax=Flavilitoribacter nigricans (strain ATCC 23147 / DSM 23189 / NBRC 102662 / NCIMB 1420 / SS-2) TaxID=1122177 RepID=A0A2D0N2V4_FLAN2|nr:histidine kinase [Flavilitoribacter nigricans]PHN02469.1 hypothetical protein CRP01_32320 [Flavilitoribacter nigricans DSM 23189 = NBRC 102662]
MVSVRILQHILFWSCFVALYAIKNMLFAGPSDLAYPPVERFFRFLLSELAFLPWKIIPFYFLFYYLIPNYFRQRKYVVSLLYFIGVLIVCLYGYRSMVTPLSGLLYGETPDFNVYSAERLLYTLTDIIPALGLAATAKLLKGRLAFQRKEEALRQEKQIAELNFLKAQTNPHFLFNTLNNLYGLARKNDRHTAPSILKLSNIMRYILHECSASSIPLANEIKIIEDYIELERLRYNDRLRVQFERQIDDPQHPVAPLILLAFVENAFKHGAGEARFGIDIDIALQLQSGQLDFQITNPCEGEAAEFLTKGTGLSNVCRQLELIYPDRHQLEIRPEAGKFSVYLSIDLRQHEG